MKRTLLLVSLLALMGGLGSTETHAKDYVGEFGAVGGWIKQDEDLSDLDQKVVHSSPFLGARLGFLLHDHVGWFAEGTHAWIKTIRPEGDTGTWDVRSGLELYGPELWEGAPLYLAGAGGREHIEFDDSDETIGRPIVSGGLGQRIALSDHVLARWEARVTHAFEDDEDLVGDEMTHYALLLGVSWAWGGSDADRDGVRDSRDECPGTPLGAVVDSRGCPTDSDGDGVWDGIDQCPGTPKGAKVNERGCPTDSDGDGVWDGIDQCAKTPKGAKVDAKGCPSDSDGDGVVDGIDQCAGTPMGAKVDAQGCPTDSDGDGVWDGIDQCPDTPAGTEVDARGCPVLFEEERSELVLEGVLFETNSATLVQESVAILDRVAQSLKAWPEIRVEVAGHTDSRGSEAHNQDLSQRRAESVRQYLISKGVSATQMTAAGYGESKPIADNATAEGRAKNRRVELRRL